MQDRVSAYLVQQRKELLIPGKLEQEKLVMEKCNKANEV